MDDKKYQIFKKEVKWRKMKSINKIKGKKVKKKLKWVTLLSSKEKIKKIINLRDDGKSGS